MSKADMISGHVEIQIVDSIEEAPKYKKEEFTILKMEKCIIVGKGTTEGNPTVDIQMTDANGKKYLVMAKAGIIEGMGSATAGKRMRDNG